MRFAEEFRSRELVKSIADRIRQKCQKQWTLMEFCGTHTVSIFRHGLKSMLPDGVKLVSGPGCPVCVTSKTDIDKILALCDIPDAIVATYGDMMKVPGSKFTLAEKRAQGADVRVIYSSYDAIELARENRGRKVFFIGIGFETTAPSTAAAVRRAKEMGLQNFKVLSLHKLTPPVIGALLEGDCAVDGFICPGHVCSIIGAKPLEPIASGYGKPCVVAGFEPGDVMQAILMLVAQLEEGRSEVEIEYVRGVTYEGNSNALKIMEEVFDITSSEWRGIGVVENTGLVLRGEFADFDASPYVPQQIRSEPDPPGCKCGDILRGEMLPPDCPLFGRLCKPSSPIGPCMVSSEGSCATYYLYARSEKWMNL